MLSELKAKQSGGGMKANSLERGLDGRIVMNIKDTEFGTTNSKTEKKKRTIPRSNLLKRKVKTKDKQFTDSTSKYLGEVYNDFVKEMDSSSNGSGNGGGERKRNQGSNDTTDANSAQIQGEIKMTIDENFRREQNNLENTDVLYSTLDHKRKIRKEKKKKEGEDQGQVHEVRNQSRPSSRRSNKHHQNVTSNDKMEDAENEYEPVGPSSIHSRRDVNGSRRSSEHRNSRRSSRHSHRSIRNRSSSTSDDDHDDHSVIIVSHEPKTENSMEDITYFDTQEDIKFSDEETVIVGDRRRDSIYFDETDGEYGTWKRDKLDK